MAATTNTMARPEAWEALYEQAVREGRDDYPDPETGYRVFIETYHLRRGFCCGSGCRHCPYGHENVKPEGKVLRS